MQIILLILIVIALVAINFIFLKFFELRILSKIKDYENSSKEQIIQSLNQNVEKIERTKDLISNNALETFKVINNLTDSLSKLSEDQKVANELSKDLKYFFDRPKLRGGFGEVILSQIVSEILPPSMYEEQYQFSNRSKVDMVIKYRDLLIPVDSKFPSEEYKRYYFEKDEKLKNDYFKNFIKQLKGIGEDVSSKYIKPEEGTSDFAIIFIPSDSIYIESIQDTYPTGEKNDLFEYLLKKRILLSGPSTFFAFLNVILAGLKQYRFVEISKEIIKNVEKLNKNLEENSQYIENLGKKIDELEKNYDLLQKSFNKTEKSFKSILSIEKEEGKNEENL